MTAGIRIGQMVSLTDGRVGRVMGFVFDTHKTGVGPFGKYPFAGARVAALQIKINQDNPKAQPEWFHPVRTIPLVNVVNA